MKKALTDAVERIAVPENLTETIMKACRAEAAQPAAPLRVVRWVPMAVSAAACIAVLGVALFAGQNKPPVPPYSPDASVSGDVSADHPENTTTTKETEKDSADSTHNSAVVSGSDASENTTATTVQTTTTSKTQVTDTTTTSAEDTTTRSTVGTHSTTVSTTAGKQSSTTVSTTEEPSSSTAASTTTTTIPSQYPSTTVNHTTRPSVGGTPTREAGILKVSTFQEMTIAELEAYYGEKIVPTQLPEGLEMRLDPDKRLGVCRKDETLVAENRDVWSSLLTSGIVRDAEVVYDCNQLRWADFIDGRRELLLHIATAPYPRYKLGDMSRFDDPITVVGTTLQAAYFEDSADCWCWSFLIPKGDIEYYIEGWNITEDEFVQMLESLIA